MLSSLLSTVLPPALSSESLLLLGFGALAAGPLLVWLLRSHQWSTVALDSFCLLTISGFALLHLLPESAEQAGWMVLPLAMLGFILPSIAERTLHHGHPGMRKTVIALAICGIAAHATLDGLFLNVGGMMHAGHEHEGTHELTAWAVILHRIPEGLGIWWIVPRTLGRLPAVAITLVSVAATLFGFYLGGSMLDPASQNALALLQSLLVGSLLHVVLHAHIPAPREPGRIHVASVFGAAVGVCVLWFVIHDHFPEREHGGPLEIFLRLAIESAPALLFAYLLVGLCHAFLPSNWLRSMTRGPKLTQALRGVAIGLPLPVCSCGVVPIYRELIKQGAAMAAAIAFLVATPELELAAVMLTWQLMGGGRRAGARRHGGGARAGRRRAGRVAGQGPRARRTPRRGRRRDARPADRRPRRAAADRGAVRLRPGRRQHGDVDPDRPVAVGDADAVRRRRVDRRPARRHRRADRRPDRPAALRLRDRQHAARRDAARAGHVARAPCWRCC